MTRRNRWITAVAAVLLLSMSPMIQAQFSASQVIQKLGYPPGSRLLIIHGDDFGVSHSVDLATEEALEKGWITSASIMVPCPWFPEVAQFAREHPNMDLGLHLTLTSEWTPYRWGPVSTQLVPTLRDKDGYLPPTEDVAAAQDSPADVAVEIRAQIMKARAAGVRFTHFDSHMDTLFQTPELFRVYQQAGRDSHVPTLILRSLLPHDGNGYVIMPDRTVLSGYVEMKPGVPLNQWLAYYKKNLAALGPGLYQLTMHLGYDDGELQAITAGKTGWGAAWRGADLKVVSSPDFQQFLKKQGFVLVTWKQIAKAEGLATQSDHGGDR